MNLRMLWKNIESRLNRDHPNWRSDIERFGQVRAVRERNQGKTWSDDEVFEALLMAILSANTDWSRIESVQTELKQMFSGFRLEAYASRRESDVVMTLVPWFEERKAGSMTLRANLVQLIDAAGILVKHSRSHGSAETYFTELMEQHDHDPKQVALYLGAAGSRHKLPSLGVPLAAEALKNLGFDVAKPDVHVCRAVAAFGLVDFVPGGSKFESPAPTARRQRQTMAKVEEIAKAVGDRVAFVDNATWMLGAKSRLHLTNAQLAELAGNNQVQRKDQTGLVALLESWEKNGDAEEQRETLDHLIRALDENRPKGYKLFPPELKGKTW